MPYHTCTIKCTCGNTEKIQVAYDLPEQPIPFVSPGYELEVFIEDILLCSGCKQFIDAESAEEQAEKEIDTYLAEVRAGV